MSDKIYVTGMHGAGTKTAGKYFADLNGVMYLQGISIGQNIDKALSLKSVCLQCPQMAHYCKRLSKDGKVYWITRDHEALVKTMYGMDAGSAAFEIMRNLNSVTRKDPVWKKVKYDGREDKKHGFVGYYSLFVKVKDYLLKKYFLPYVEVIQAENMPYWDESVCKKHALTMKQKDFMNYYFDYWEKVSEGL